MSWGCILKRRIISLMWVNQPSIWLGIAAVIYFESSLQLRAVFKSGCRLRNREYQFFLRRALGSFNWANISATMCNCLWLTGAYWSWLFWIYLAKTSSWYLVKRACLISSCPRGLRPACRSWTVDLAVPVARETWRIDLNWPLLIRWTAQDAWSMI